MCCPGTDALGGLCALWAGIPASSLLAAAQRPPVAGAGGGQTAEVQGPAAWSGAERHPGGHAGTPRLAGLTWRQKFSLLHQERGGRSSESAVATENGMGFKTCTEVQSPLLKTDGEADMRHEGGAMCVHTMASTSCTPPGPPVRDPSGDDGDAAAGAHAALPSAQGTRRGGRQGPRDPRCWGTAGPTRVYEARGPQRTLGRGCWAPPLRTVVGRGDKTMRKDGAYCAPGLCQAL